MRVSSVTDIESRSTSLLMAPPSIYAPVLAGPSITNDWYEEAEPTLSLSRVLKAKEKETVRIFALHLSHVCLCCLCASLRRFLLLCLLLAPMRRRCGRAS